MLWYVRVQTQEKTKSFGSHSLKNGNIVQAAFPIQRLPYSMQVPKGLVIIISGYNRGLDFPKWRKSGSTTNAKWLLVCQFINFIRQSSLRCEVISQIRTWRDLLQRQDFVNRRGDLDQWFFLLLVNYRFEIKTHKHRSQVVPGMQEYLWFGGLHKKTDFYQMLILIQP